MALDFAVELVLTDMQNIARKMLLNAPLSTGEQRELSRELRKLINELRGILL